MSKILSLLIALSTLPLHAAEPNLPPKLPKEITGEIKKHLGTLDWQENRLEFRCPSFEEVQAAVQDRGRIQTINGMEFYYSPDLRPIPKTFTVSFDHLAMPDKIDMKIHANTKKPQSTAYCSYSLVSDQDASQKSAVTLYANLPDEVKSCTVQGFIEKKKWINSTLYSANSPENLIISCPFEEPVVSPDVTSEKFLLADQFSLKEEDTDIVEGSD